jgi:hypothetical protein
MGFRSDVSRVQAFGLGCAAGASGLSIASRLAQARPGTNVLLVAVELCLLALRHDELTKANIMAVSLFGDGAAAIVLRAGDGGATRIEHSGEHLWPDTLDVMDWSVDPQGFGVILRRTVPEFVTENLKPALIQILGRMQFDPRRYRPIHLPSRRRGGTLSVSVASQLCCRGRRDRRPAAGAGADARRHLHDPQRGGSDDPHPRRKRRPRRFPQAHRAMSATIKKPCTEPCTEPCTQIVAIRLPAPATAASGI